MTSPTEPPPPLGPPLNAAELPGGHTFVRYQVVLVATVASVLLYLDRVCISTAAGFIQSDLKLSDAQVSWILSAFFWSYALSQVPSGWLSDRFGGRLMMAMYVLAWSVFTAQAGLANGFVMLLSLRLLIGVAQAGAYPTAGSLLSRWVPLSARGTASSIVAFGGRVGGAMAPPLTGALIAWFGGAGGWRTTMMVYGAVGVVVAAVVWAVFRDRPEEHPGCGATERQLIARGRILSHLGGTTPSSRSGETLQTLGRLVSSPSMWLMCISQWGTNIGWVFLVTWLPIYLERAQNVKDPEVLGLLAGVPLFVGMAGMLLGGHVTDWCTRKLGLRWGRSLPLAVSRFAAAAAFVALLWLDAPRTTIAAFAMVAFFTDLGVAGTWAYMQDVGGKYVGSVLGWGNMWGNLGAAVSPPLLYWVNSFDTNKDWHESFLVCAAAFFVSGIASLGINATISLAPGDNDP